MEGMHSIQARMSKNDPRLYNVNRDIAHNFKEVATYVANRLEDELWPELADLLRSRGVTEDDLGNACESFVLFVGTGASDPDVDMPEALQKAGWHKLKPEAQIAVMAVLGTVILGMQFAGVREATLGGDGPAMSIREIVGEHGGLAEELVSRRRSGLCGWLCTLFRKRL